MENEKLFRMRFGSIYPLYVTKAERKGRSKAEVDEIIMWLTGYGADALAAVVAGPQSLESFLGGAPQLNPARLNVTGVVCGVRVEAVEDPLLREIRILDKLIDELARGKAMSKILRAAQVA